MRQFEELIDAPITASERLVLSACSLAFISHVLSDSALTAQFMAKPSYKAIANQAQRIADELVESRQSKESMARMCIDHLQIDPRCIYLHYLKDDSSRCIGDFSAK